MSTDTLWHSIATSIEDKIKSGRFAPGDRLPTEAEFVDEFRVNRHTVRRALTHLQDKDLVESVQGRGTFVRRPALRYEIGRRTRFSEALRKQAVRGGSETKAITLTSATPEVASALELNPRTKVIRLHRIGFVEDTPVSISYHYFSHERFPFFKNFYERKGSVTETLIASGVPDFFRKKTVVDAKMPSAEECATLNVPKHVPLLFTKAWNIDSFGRPLEYGECLFASDRVELEITATEETVSDVVDTSNNTTSGGLGR